MRAYRNVFGYTVELTRHNLETLLDKLASGDSFRTIMKPDRDTGEPVYIVAVEDEDHYSRPGEVRA